ncbi:V-set and immunoglobulin domain-containing protein 1 [Sceloporus undulatus]|uniref:V-set and immunoglobulin domain-containing protein 1 n=1 Tax=Sceloporus undulatus TaxID=8520 RepID=UPI001C4D93D2|nr:V-set and immunoglobulin domain-containing protein 1 [Sceloporus undulatus]
MNTEATMLKIFVILVAFTGPVSCAVVPASQRSVNTTVGGNITLPCMYNMDAPVSDLFIQWMFYNAKLKNSAIIYYFQKSQPYTSTEYKNRILIANSTGNASLTIFNMKPWETGVYTCEVLISGTPPSQVEKSFPVYVLTPPSKPLCSFSHSQKVELGHFITLSCLSEIGMPNPKYYWHRVSGDTIMRVSEYYDPQTGLLEIGNLTKLEEGYYQCIAINSLGNSTCQIDLTIKHSESGVIAAALIAAILAAALICVIVWILTSKEKKKRRKEKAAISEMQTMAQKEPLTSGYAAVPSQENVPVAAVPPSKDSNETGEYVTPDEIEAAAVPENERQEMEHQSVA